MLEKFPELIVILENEWFWIYVLLVLVITLVITLITGFVFKRRKAQKQIEDEMFLGRKMAKKRSVTMFTIDSLIAEDKVLDQDLIPFKIIVKELKEYTLELDAQSSQSAKMKADKLIFKNASKHITKSQSLHIVTDLVNDNTIKY